MSYEEYLSFAVPLSTHNDDGGDSCLPHTNGTCLNNIHRFVGWVRSAKGPPTEEQMIVQLLLAIGPLALRQCDEALEEDLNSKGFFLQK